MHPRETICPYCGVGCRVQATVEGDHVTRIQAVDTSRPNFGKLCPKGAYLTRVLDTPDRLAYPMLRVQREDTFDEVNWGTAINFVARRLRKIITQYGARAVAFYGSGQLDTEASYLAGKLFKGFLRTNHTDTNSRLCMSSAVAGYVTSLGSDGPPTCYDDIAHADLFFIVGANMAENHPVLFQFVKARRRDHRNARVIVVDPRRTPTAQHADVHVRIAPGGDIAFLNALCKLIVERGKADRRFVSRNTEGFEEFEKFLREQSLDELNDVCGVPVARLDEVAQLIISSQRVLSLYCMGTNQSTVGVWKNNALINLHLLTGQIGKVGAGPFSLTGQPNAMGGREAGYLSHQLPGYRFIANAQHRVEVERLWDIPEKTIQPQPGLMAVEMFDALATGDIKAIWIAATNPAASMPNLNVVQEGLRRAELVIVQDIYHPTETTQYAHVLLPAAQWGEKVGTMTNSERLVTRSVQLVRPPGVAKPDWWVFARIARAMGFHGFDFQNADAVWDEYRLVTKGTLCDQWGMTNQRLRQGPLQWPCPHEKHPGTPRRYTDWKFPTPSGKAKFWCRPHQPPAETTDEEFPLALTTGRIASQWHTRTRTGKIPELVRHAPEPFVEMHPQDAERLGITDGDFVCIESRRGRAQAKVKITKDIRAGVVFAPFHWGDLWSEDSAINDATNSAFDPISKQPELKHCAVRVSPVDCDGVEPRRTQLPEQNSIVQEVQLPESSATKCNFVAIE